MQPTQVIHFVHLKSKKPTHSMIVIANCHLLPVRCKLWLAQICQRVLQVQSLPLSCSRRRSCCSVARMISYHFFISESDGLGVVLVVDNAVLSPPTLDVLIPQTCRH